MNHTGKIMEYYILKCYQESKNECPDVEQGFDRFEPKIKKIVIACLVAVAGIWIYSYTFFDTLKRKYELMIKDLLLLKY